MNSERTLRVTAVAAVVVIAGTILVACAPAASPAPAPQVSGMPVGGLSQEALQAVRQYPQALLVAQFYRPFETGDGAVYDHIMQPGWIDVPRADGQQPGRDGLGMLIAASHTAMPNLRLHIDEIVVASNTVTVRSTLTGSQDGPFLGVAGTGRTITFRTTDVHHVSDGLIASTDHLEDLFGAYQQITSR